MNSPTQFVSKHCWKFVFGIFVSIALCFFILNKTSMQFSEFVLTTPSGISQEIEFPFFAESRESGIYQLKGKVNISEKTDKRVRIIPDDEILSLQVNQSTIDLSTIPADQKRDYNMGFTLDLSNYLHTGTNTLVIVYSDAGGKMGMLVAPTNETNFHKNTYYLLIVLCLLLLLVIFSKTKLQNSFKLILLGAVILRLAYFSVTPPNVRDHDLGDHTDYIEYIATHWHPAPIEMATGGAFFHPPFYYYTGALTYKLGNQIFPCNKVQIYRIEQLLSLFYSILFVFFGLKILENLLNLYQRAPKINPMRFFSVSDWRNAYANNGLFWIIGTLFALWPSTIIHSTRIGNDALLYPLIAASLYFILLWHQSDKTKYLIIASIIGAFSIVTKANGEILIASIAVIGLYKMLKTKAFLHYLKTAIIPCIILFSAFAITVTPGLILKMQGKRDKLYVDNIDGLSQANIVGNTAANYFWFDTKIFITEPFTSPYDDRMGRQYFWNYLSKTGLFGEFTYTGIQCINFAIYCSFLFIVMMLINLIGLFYLRKSDFKRLAPILLVGFFLWGGVTYMRMTFPANIDFRYILPIIISFTCLYGITLIKLNEHGFTRLASIGKIVAGLFSLCSVFFIFGIQPI